jgi:membrane protease subunit HflK
MYLETMERVLGGTDKIILDSGAGGVVPYLPLNELLKPNTSQASSATSAKTQGAKP